jgi:hypothetical protein
MNIEYMLGKINTLADALSRKTQLVVLDEEDEFPTSGVV